MPNVKVIHFSEYKCKLCDISGDKYSCQNNTPNLLEQKTIEKCFKTVLTRLSLNFEISQKQITLNINDGNSIVTAEDFAI